MTLTEEQLAALKRVVAYMDEMYAVASPYHGCTEDANRLRAMIDSSGTVEPTGGFDLEKARTSISHYWIENPSNVDTECALKELVDQANLAEDALAEIERLRAENAWLKSDREFQSEEQAARIKELEDTLVEKQTALMPSAPRCYADARRQAAIEQLQAEGKIGPDAKPRSWQITEERMRAIRMAEELAWDCKAVAVLRAMLQEAGL